MKMKPESKCVQACEHQLSPVLLFSSKFCCFIRMWSAPVSAYPKLKQQQKIRSRERLALLEQQKLAPVLGNKLVRCLRKISHGFGGNEIRHRLSPILGKSDADFEEISHRFLGSLSWSLGENPSPICGKSVTDFEEICHRLRGNLPPTSGKSAADFGAIRHRLWENLAPLWENQPPTEENRLRVWERQAPFWIGLGQSSSLLCFF